MSPSEVIDAIVASLLGSIIEFTVHRSLIEKSEIHDCYRILKRRVYLISDLPIAFLSFQVVSRNSGWFISGSAQSTSKSNTILHSTSFALPINWPLPMDGHANFI
jgi:hypothetical protein